VLDEILNQLKKRGSVKVRILRSALQDDKARNIAEKVAQKTNSILIEVRGHTFILYRPRER